MTDDSGMTLMERYHKKFGFDVPVACWHGSPADLRRLMEQAIDEGRPLTAARLYAVQDMPAPSPEDLTCSIAPPGAVT